MASQELIDHIQNRAKWRLHTGTCETVVGTKVPTNPITGETYDVYIIPHCDCWVSEDTDSISLKEASRILETLAGWSGRVQHDRGCDRLYPEPIVYRGQRELLWKNCNCWVTDWKG
jgi:hypothetical protein